MHWLLRLARVFSGMLFAGLIAGLVGIVSLWLYYAPQLPTITGIEDLTLQVPLRVYSRDGAVIAEYGAQRRHPVAYEDLPKPLIQAVVSAEDDRFFEHPGVDWQGLLRAAISLVATGDKVQGGSTITMQAARNFFLTPDKTYERKIKEIFLALKMERRLTKEQILELYLNKIYLGQRAYGVEAAAQVYYGVSVQDLTLPQMAMLAGLPKAPSALNPLANPERAEVRRNYVLGRMHEQGYLTEPAYREAVSASLTAKRHGAALAFSAPYIGEMARQFAVERYGEQAYTMGIKLYTTVDAARQRAAQQALTETLLAYDRRHGYRGSSARIELPAGVEQVEGGLGQALVERLEEALEGYPAPADLHPAVVLKVAKQSARVYVAAAGLGEIPWEGMSWARRYIDENRRGPAPDTAGDVLRAGDVIYVTEHNDKRWMLSQIPQAQAALVALDPFDGAVISLVGGFDFGLSAFNRAVQAQRQPGSSFKPFFYAAALNEGFTPASIINDAPVVFDDPALESVWRPENYTGRFYGPTRLREALVHSRNLVSIRLMREIGVGRAIEYAGRFGFDRSSMPRDLSLSLGSLSVSPMALARAYAVFANGGYLVEPYVIERIEDDAGRLLYKASPHLACEDCLASTTPVTSEPGDDAGEGNGMIENAIVQVGSSEAAALVQAPWREGLGIGLGGPEFVPLPPRYAPRVVDADVAYLMNSMLQDVVRRGTGTVARKLERIDLAAKTGTTNDLHDAWFSGFNRALVATAWVGFDQAKSLGRGEAGASTAGPLWVSYMDEALKGIEEQPLKQPPGMVMARISPSTGERVMGASENAIFEVFRQGNLPPPASGPTSGPGTADGGSPDGGGIQELF